MKYSDEELESIIDRMKSLLDAYDTADKEFQDKQDHDAWEAEFGDKLSPYYDKMKAINGDDFSLLDEARKEYANEYSDCSKDEYVAALTANIDKLLDKLRGALGEEKVELESGPEGTEIVSHEDKGIEANAEGDKAEVDMTSDEKAKEKPEDKKIEDVLSNGEISATEVLSSENAKTRYEKRSASNKEKLKGWDPSKRLTLSDEESKEPIEEKAKEVAKETPNKVDDVVVQALTETPKTEEKDEYKEFMDDLKKYSK